jgi:hypothetical protein
MKNIIKYYPEEFEEYSPTKVKITKKSNRVSFREFDDMKSTSSQKKKPYVDFKRS